MMSPSSAGDFSTRLKDRARELGFSLVGITPAARPETLEQFQSWLRQGMHATMEYMPRREKAYEHPQGVQVGVKSVIIAAINYGPGVSSEQGTAPTGKVAAYAQGTADYHDVLRQKLQQLADELHALCPEARTRIAVDTAPILERDFARRAGLGWFGKNTMLINKWSGSYFFLGAILTDIELTPDAPHQTDHCGTCTRCLEACPTQAFPEPYVLDAGRCISYLTIELRDRPIPLNLRSGMNDWIFGCDVCQQVCPWNRKSTPPMLPEFQTHPDSVPSLEQLLNLSDEEFQERFGDRPFARPGRIGMARNAAIVLGNIGGEADLPILIRAMSADSPLIRGAAAWGVGKIGGLQARHELARSLHHEAHEDVRREIEAAIKALDAADSKE
ncbi:tRNA epoxyqueuosine(34) reductase QueG [Planctomicrobium sp. SH661]|uniref:tRNA epoxyqueuosine(34) reductase QueG n=1 Tax=Planctomicrobium sp. SH661 TaxID=3448124 RepID=UPI003F5C59EB